MPTAMGCPDKELFSGNYFAGTGKPRGAFYQECQPRCTRRFRPGLGPGLRPWDRGIQPSVAGASMRHDCLSTCAVRPGGRDAPSSMGCHVDHSNVHPLAASLPGGCQTPERGIKASTLTPARPSTEVYSINVLACQTFPLGPKT
jgi:hypothetical protein